MYSQSSQSYYNNNNNNNNNQSSGHNHSYKQHQYQHYQYDTNQKTDSENHKSVTPQNNANSQYDYDEYEYDYSDHGSSDEYQQQQAVINPNDNESQLKLENVASYDNKNNVDDTSGLIIDYESSPASIYPASTYIDDMYHIINLEHQKNKTRRYNDRVKMLNERNRNEQEAKNGINDINGSIINNPNGGFAVIIDYDQTTGKYKIIDGNDRVKSEHIDKETLLFAKDPNSIIYDNSNTEALLKCLNKQQLIEIIKCQSITLDSHKTLLKKFNIK